MYIENTPSFDLASRWSRLWAALIDTVIGLVLSIPFIMYFNVFDYAKRGIAIPFEISLITSAIGFCLFLLLHGYLISKKGQTIGKMLMSIKIVNTDNTNANFTQIAFFRYLPMSLVALLPVVGQFLSTLDCLFIFRKDKRCVHDLIASTRVVKS